MSTVIRLGVFWLEPKKSKLITSETSRLRAAFYGHLKSYKQVFGCILYSLKSHFQPTLSLIIPLPQTIHQHPHHARTSRSRNHSARHRPSYPQPNYLRRNRPPAQAALANPARAARNPAWACRARMPPPRQISADSF